MLSLEARRARSDRGRTYYAANREARKAYQRAYKQTTQAAAKAEAARVERLITTTDPVMDTALGKLVVGVLWDTADIYAEITGDKHTLDHVIPLCLGGAHAPWNLRPMTVFENLTRRKSLS